MKVSSIVQTPATHDLEATHSFYKSLGFQEVTSFDRPMYSDGKVLIAVNPDRTARTAIRLFGEWDSILETIKSQTEVHEIGDSMFCSDPNGVQLFLEPTAEFEVAGQQVSVLGNFAGLSIETTDFGRSVDFWQSLGYQKGAGDASQGWLTLEREGWFGISLMKAGVCPHLFFSPGLTYFNSGKNQQNIEKIREASIEITEEISCFNTEGIVDNVILRDPAGTGFFIFND